MKKQNNKLILEIDKEKHTEMSFLDRKFENFFSKNIILISNPFPYLDMMKESRRVLEHRLVYVKTGKVVHIANFEQYTATSRDLFLIPINSIVSVISASEDAEFHIMGFDLPMLKFPWFSGMPTQYFKLSPSDLEYIDTCYSLINTTVRKENISFNVVEHLIMSMLAFLLSVESNQSKRGNDTFITTGQRIKTDFLSLISSTEFKKTNIQSIANKLGVSQGYLSQTIKKETGKSVMHWINERVISDAKMMLRNKEISIDDIRLKLGFKTLPHFTNFFKQNVGINPQNYRNNVEDLPY